MSSTFVNESFIKPISVDDVLRTCREIPEAHREPPLVAFQMASEAARLVGLLFASVPRHTGHIGGLGVEIRTSCHIPKHLVIPIVRDENGEETWGEPFSIFPEPEQEPHR